MKRDDEIDFTTLSWVKRELDDTMRKAQQALEAYVDDPTDLAEMRHCAGHLHQVHGTLRMVELYGAAMVVEDMEALAQALLDDQVAERNDAYSALMRGLVQIPDYLERIQSGHRDIPVVLLSLLNELRTARGQAEVTEAVLFAPNLGAELPAEAPGASVPIPTEEQRTIVNGLRQRFQVALLHWMRTPDGGNGLADMRQILDEMAAACYSVTGRRLWWIAGGVIEGLQAGKLEQQRSELRKLIGRVDRAMKQLLDGGEMMLSRGDAEDLARQLLYYVAQTDASTPRLDALRATYRLGEITPEAKEVEGAISAMSGHNRALLDTVSEAIKEDLLRVKDALDLFLRSPGNDPAELAPQVDVLDRVDDTLGMLGLAVPQRVIQEQHNIVADIVAGSRGHDEGTLLDVAGSLLYVESSIDEHIEHLGAADDGKDDTAVGAEARRVLTALMGEAAANLAAVKRDITAFIETPWNHAEVDNIPRLLDEIGGAMRMLDVDRPADLLNGIASFIENELVIDKRVPTAEQMDKMADALASVEYFLEATRDNRSGRDRILDVAESSLAEIGYWPVPERRERPPEDVAVEARPKPAESSRDDLTDAVEIAPGAGLEDLVVGSKPDTTPAGHDIDGMKLVETGEQADTGDAAAASADDVDWIEVEEEIEEQVPVEDGASGFQEASGEIDEEIREIFVEEFEEEIASLEETVRAWKENPGDLEKLTPIRRSFHTLKGSGRLVGATGVGEFSWKVESMLNRVLDRSIEASADVEALVDHAIAALPSLLSMLKGEQAEPAPVAAIMQTADKLAEGQSARVEDIPVATRTVKRIVKRRIPRPVEPESQILAEDDVAAPLDAESVETTGDEVPAEEAAAAAAPETGVAATDAEFPAIDPVLLDILRSEVEQHAGVMQGFCEAHASGTETVVNEQVLRAVHTLSGAVSMVEIPALCHVLSPLEGYLKRMRAERRELPDSGREVIAESAALALAVMQQYESDQPDLPATGDLAERIIAMRDVLPEPQLEHALYFDQAPEDAEAAEADSVEPAEPVESTSEETVPELTGPDLGDAGFASDGAEQPIEAPEAEQDSADEITGQELPLAGGEDWLRELEQAAAALPSRAGDEQPLDELVDDVAGDQEQAEEPQAPVDEAEPETESDESADAGTADALDSPPQAEPETEPEPYAEAEAEDQAEIEAEAEAEGQPEAEAEPESEPGAEPEPELEPEPVAEAESQAQPEDLEEIEADAGYARFALADDPQPDGPLDIPDLDPELLEIFVQEATDILDSADGAMANLREQPGNLRTVEALQRDLHTLKGGARMAGLAPIGDLGHSMESLFEVIAAGQREADRGVVEHLEHAFDCLHKLVQRVSSQRAIAMPDNLIGAMEALARGDKVVAGAETVSEQAPETVAAGQPAEPAAPAPKPEVAPREPAPNARASQELIRVRSDLLDSLVNYAGEVSIYRSRLEEQVSTFRFNLVEFEQTVSRLRDQLRQMEIETEAQIIARYQREQHEMGEGSFDPLELDRFSQLQQYSRSLSESVSDLVSIQTLLDDITRQSETLLLQQSRVSSDLQEGLMRTRMVPFDSLVPSLRRTLRQAAQETGKRAQMKVVGAQGEMDRNLLERMKAPFEHMLRNAVAHGIETPEQRLEAGKPVEGTVRIEVSRDATEVVVRLSDDGRGINRDAVRAKAIERGLMSADAELSDRDLFAFMMETGFSTADEVTQLAGRGVGLDVVASEIKQLGGSLAIDSEAARGTTFTVRLPFTLAVTQAILIRLGEHTFAVPMTSVQGVVRIARDDLQRRLANPDQAHYDYAGDSYEMHDLSGLLSLPASHLAGEAQVPLLMTRTGDQRAAVRIDSVVGSREIVVKPVGPQVSSVPGIFGATIMGDGSVVMILDLAPLVRRSVALRETADELESSLTPEAEVATREKPLVMVVDDSITMRKVTTRVLERHDLDVVTAKDGLDAVEQLQEHIPDLMLLDIEMPRMDGYELATYMRNDPRLAGVPIIMVTSRTGEKHRQRALEVGVEHYLGKPYQEADLVRNVNELLDASRV